MTLSGLKDGFLTITQFKGVANSTVWYHVFIVKLVTKPYNFVSLFVITLCWFNQCPRVVYIGTGRCIGE